MQPVLLLSVASHLPCKMIYRQQEQNAHTTNVDACMLSSRCTSKQISSWPELLVAVTCVLVVARYGGKYDESSTLRLIDVGPGSIGNGMAFKVRLPSPSGIVHVFSGPIGPEQLAIGIQPDLTSAAKFPPLTSIGLLPKPVIFVLAPSGTLVGSRLVILPTPPQSFHVTFNSVNVDSKGGLEEQHPLDASAEG